MLLEIKQHSLAEDIVEVEGYDPIDTMQKLTEKDERGNRVHEYIVFGKNIYSTISIQSVRVKED